MSREIYSPSIEQVLQMGDVDLCNGIQESDPSKEIVALATPVFQSIQPRVFDCHKMLVAQMANDLGENLWLIPSQERMPYPDACLFAVASMISSEAQIGRSADWFLWLEDDTIVPPDLFTRLREVADPEERPFIACVGYDRYPKFLPAVWDRTPDGRLKRWVKPPQEDGIVKVAATGLVAALFHRSLFQRVPQPWFGITARILKETMDGMSSEEDKPVTMGMGFKPDMLWSRQLNEAGIPIYVHCGIQTTHMGMPLPINGRTSPILREMSFMDRDNLEAMTRGHTRGDNSISEEITDDQRAECDPAGPKPDSGSNPSSSQVGRECGGVHADIRQSVSEGMGRTHGTGNELGETILT